MSKKKELSDSLYSLMKRISFDNITVDMIISRPEIARSTFYKYFKDKYDLLNWYHKDKIETAIQNIKPFSCEKLFIEMLEFIYSEKEYFRKAFSVEGQNSFKKYLHEICTKYATENYKTNKNIENLDTYEIYTIRFYIVGCLEIIENWLVTGAKQSVPELTEFLISLAPHSLAQYIYTQ